MIFKFVPKKNRELERAFKVLPAKFAKKVLRKGLREGAKIFQREIKTQTPVGGTGDLKKQVKVKAGKRSTKFIAVKAVVSGDDFHGNFVHLGTEHMPKNPYIKQSFNNKANIAEAKTAEVIRQETRKLLLTMRLK